MAVRHWRPPHLSMIINGEKVTEANNSYSGHYQDINRNIILMNNFQEGRKWDQPGLPGELRWRHRTDPLRVFWSNQGRAVLAWFNWAEENPSNCTNRDCAFYNLTTGALWDGFCLEVSCPVCDLPAGSQNFILVGVWTPTIQKERTNMIITVNMWAT